MKAPPCAGCSSCTVYVGVATQRTAVGPVQRGVQHDGVALGLSAQTSPPCFAAVSFVAFFPGGAGSFPLGQSIVVLESFGYVGVLARAVVWRCDLMRKMWRFSTRKQLKQLQLANPAETNESSTVVAFRSMMSAIRYGEKLCIEMHAIGRVHDGAERCKAGVFPLVQPTEAVF